MNIKEVLYQFKLKYDKLDTKKQFNLSLPQQLLILNEAQDKIVVNTFGTNNSIKEGFETTQVRIQQLRPISVNFDDSPTLLPTKIDDYTYTVDLNLLPKFLFVTRGYSEATKGECKDAVVFNIEVPHGDLTYILSDPHNNPSFEWGEVPVDYANNKMYLYSDGTFDITKVHVEYLRYPKKMDIIGYTHFDGTASVNQDPELPDFFVYKIIDEGVKMAQGYIDNQTGVLISQDRLAENS